MRITYTRNGVEKELIIKNKIDVLFYVRIYPVLLWISDVIEGTAILLWWFLTDPNYIIWAGDHEGTRCLDERWKFFERHSKKSNAYVDMLNRLCDFAEN